MKTKYSVKKETKGKESTNYQSNNGKHKDARSQSSDSPEEFDFAFPVLQTVDRTRHLHCYSSILNRNKEDAVTMEDLDRLQPELEVMFSCAALRAITLKAEIAALTNAEESKSEIKPTSVIINQRKRKLSDARLTKSLKDLSKVRGRDGFNKEISSENDTDNSADILSDLPVESSKVTLPKNDTPNKFWLSVEPYAKDITKDNIKDLEDMIMSCENDIRGVSIPPLGRHYSTTWAEEDLNQSSVTSDKAEIMMKRAASLCERTPGPLVQRLVSALMEEPSNDSYSNKLDSDSDSYSYLSKVPLFHTTACFERRLKRELEAVGFLDGNENEDSDEIMAEIKKCQEELQIVAAQNKEQLEQLIVKAKHAVKKQDVKVKIRSIENELTEIYRKTAAAKLKKKQLKKKEKDQAWKLIKEREQLMNLLESSKYEKMYNDV